LRDQAEDDPQRWYSTNLVGLPAGLIASLDFNRHPQPLSIHGTREAHRGLFRLLDEADDLAAAADIFRHYMQIVFGRARPPDGACDAEQRRFHVSYLKLLQGWGFDANSPQGAVLKGWVESRFGLIPNFHRAPLARFPSPAWVQYLEEKHGSRFHNNSIHAQLDLLWEYCQWAVQRFGLPAREQVRLWRGVNRNDGQIVMSGSLRQGECVVRFNNLVSFTTLRERAEEFGDWILETQVPAVKLLFFPGLLGKAPLSGEGEVLALGGLYQVRAAYA
jgi:NAD+--dinitrogen-reductase ADP-D-ribosyltransferase